MSAPPLDRAKLAAYAPYMLFALDSIKRAHGLTHDETIATLAAAIASWPAGDRAVFRALFDHIEQEMHAHRPAGHA
jgi:hypothetical protein